MQSCVIRDLITGLGDTDELHVMAAIKGDADKTVLAGQDSHQAVALLFPLVPSRCHLNLVCSQTLPPHLDESGFVCVWVTAVHGVSRRGKTLFTGEAGPFPDQQLDQLKFMKCQNMFSICSVYVQYMFSICSVYVFI